MSSVYGFGQQWTGALSRGPTGLFLEEAPALSPEEMQQFGECQNLVSLNGVEGRKCLAASAGWGHTALLVADETNADVKPKLMVCGRPHDFQTLLRLRRLPPFIRKFCIKYTLPSEEDEQLDDQSPSILQRIASYLAGEEVILNEAECRRFSNMPTLLEIDLPNGEIPAIEGERVNKATFEQHAAGRIANQQEKAPLHTHFQNILATSAGVTAVISKSGTLYTFGLNQRGQCGSGSFSPNVWNPSPVVGLASSRFILDHGTGTGEDMFKEFKEQENPIVSVALGLQHGVALDSEGQVFCWGKGERGQLGQGRRMTHEGLIDGEEHSKQSEEDEPNENRTFEYALQVANFYDPHATTLPSSSDDMMYAPLLSKNDSKVRLISAGMNFTVAVTTSNLPYIWGKNVCLNPSYSESGINVRSKPVQDSPYPRYIPGLPTGLRIERIACGTHHAAMLLEDGSIWAVGVATDKPVPLWDEAVEILAPGLVEMDELVSFTAGFDRTLVVYGGQNQPSTTPALPAAEDFSKLTVLQLKDKLRELNLPLSGRKQDLIDRMNSHIHPPNLNEGGDKGTKRQVIEIQLWSNEELRQHGAVRPSWIDWLDGGEGRAVKVSSVHRGWMHTVIVTEEE